MPTPASIIKEAEARFVCENDECGNYQHPTNLIPYWELPPASQIRHRDRTPYGEQPGTVTECCGSGEWRRKAS